jgi:amidophosphoribosyltransferase
MPAASELVACGRTEDEVAQYIGADWLIYQDLDDLIRAVRYDNGSIKDFDTSCFSGQYVTGDVTTEYLREIEVNRSDAAKQARKLARKQQSVQPDSSML